MPRLVGPSDVGVPLGYSTGVVAECERLLFISSQVALGRDRKMAGPDLVAQFTQSLDNFLGVVQQSGGRPENVVQMRIYVTDRKEYRSRAKELGVVWRSRMGRHYPALTLVEVAALMEEGARVSIEGIAAL